jgi:hypothetical protein
MSKARDLANAGTALTTVSATELGYLDGVTSAVQTQINSKEATLPSQTGNTGKYLTTDGTDKSWGTVSQYALPSQTGNSGKFLTTNGTSESWGTVTVPVTWNNRYTHTSLVQFGTIATNNSGTYVVAGTNGALVSSTDGGITWTARTSQFGSNAISCVVYGNNLWVAVGDGGVISTSTDAITWTARTSNFNANTFRTVKYLNGTWIAGGDGASGGTGGIATSTDGITWTRRTTPASTTTTIFSLAYGNGYYVAVGSGTTTGIYSTNLTTWTALPTVTGAAGFVYYTSNNQFVIKLPDSQSVWFTGNNPTTGWTQTSQNVYITDSQILGGLEPCIKLYNGKFYYINQQGIAGQQQMYVSSTTISSSTSGFSTFEYGPSLPMMPYNSSVNYKLIYSLEINSSGGFVISGQNGRIWTSF